MIRLTSHRAGQPPEELSLASLRVSTGLEDNCAHITIAFTAPDGQVFTVKLKDDEPQAGAVISNNRFLFGKRA